MTDVPAECSIDRWARTRDDIKKYLNDPDSFTSIACNAVAWAIGKAYGVGDHEDHVAVAVENMIGYLLKMHPMKDPEHVFGRMYQAEFECHHGDEAKTRGSVGEIIMGCETLSEHSLMDRDAVLESVF